MRNVEEGWNERHWLGGFGSGEAFIQHAAEHPGDPIYMTEPELGRVLTVASRDGSSWSSVPRSALDYRPMELRTRSDKNHLVAPKTPVAMMGHITADELTDRRSGLRSVDALNGFGNRILWMHVDRRRIEPNLRPVPPTMTTNLTRRLHDVLVRGRGAGVLIRSPEADDLWADLYAAMAADDPPGSIAALTSRAEAQVLRLSLIYALLEGADRIERPYLESAWEVWRYAR